MSRHDTMRDPRSAPILLQIERCLHDTDKLAAARGLTLTDSNVRSVLVRAVNEAKGKTAKSAEPASSDKDRLLTEALHQLAAVRGAIVEEQDRPDGSLERRPLPAGDWIAALETIKDSCALRTGREPGSRGYLGYVRGFLENMAKPR
jgi:hypothetical protein